MSKTLYQMIGAPTMLGLIETVKTGIRNPLPVGFTTPNRGIQGVTGYYNKVSGTRTTARFVQYGAPSRRRELKGVSQQPFTCLHSFEHVFHDPLVLQNLQNVDNPTVQEFAVNEIIRQTREFNQVFDNLRIAAVISAISQGAIYFDGSGNLLSTSSGAVVSIDFSVPAGNKNQLNVLGAGNVIATAWSDADTEIAAQIELLKDSILKLNGYEITTAFYGSSILGWLYGNASLRAMIAGNPNYVQSFLTNAIPNGFLGLNWVPVRGAYFVDQDGTTQSMWAQDKVVFTPDASPDWYELIEGSYMVPTNLGSVSENAEGAAGQVRQVRGRFQYAKVIDDPVTVQHFAGDTFVPVIKVPAAVCIADVDF